jgi:hypothetical protein
MILRMILIVVSVWLIVAPILNMKKKITTTVLRDHPLKVAALALLDSLVAGVGIVNLVFLLFLPSVIRDDIKEFERLKKEYRIISASPLFHEMSDLDKANTLAKLAEYQKTLKNSQRLYKATTIPDKWLKAYLPEEIEKVKFVE